MTDENFTPEGHRHHYRHDEPYGFMERELAFKLLASHALVDAEYFEWLRKDPAGAAAQLHVRLTDGDLDYLTNVVDWDRITEMAGSVRDSLHLEKVTSSW